MAEVTFMVIKQIKYKAMVMAIGTSTICLYRFLEDALSVYVHKTFMQIFTTYIKLILIYEL